MLKDMSWLQKLTFDHHFVKKLNKNKKTKKEEEEKGKEEKEGRKENILDIKTK